MSTAAGLSTLFALLGTLCRAADLSEREGSGSESGSGDSSDSSEPVLSAGAIANIAASAAAVAVLGGAMCYLLMCFNKQERMERVRAAQERNRQISRRLEAAKQGKKEKQQTPSATERQAEVGEEGGAAGSLLFSAVHRSHLEDDDNGTSRDSSQPLVTQSPASQRPLT